MLDTSHLNIRSATTAAWWSSTADNQLVPADKNDATDTYQFNVLTRSQLRFEGHDQSMEPSTTPASTAGAHP